MVYRILVPLDGSSRAERAILVVDRLAEAMSAEVELLRVVDPADVLTTSTVAAATPEILSARAQQAERYLDDAAKRFHRGPPTATRVLQGPASTTISDHARSGSFDLIVMSSHGQTGLVDALLGSVARAVVRESAVPVLILRERTALPQEVRGLGVIVPLDGSPIAESVLTPLMPLAKALEWRLHLLWVTDVRNEERERETVPVGDQRARDARPEMVAYLERLAAGVRAGGSSAEVRIESGDCAACIVRCAEPDDVDLIAIGTHGRHGIGRLVLGSVAEHVIARASKPVLAIRPRAD